MIEFDVLGPIVVRRNKTTVAIAARMLRRQLAVLLSRAGRPVSVADLADAMWEGARPDGARKALQVYVHRLRRALSEEGRIQYTAAGYQLVVARAELDSWRFVDLAERGRAERRAGDLTQSSVFFRQALDLWRGEPYADVRAGPILADEARWLADKRLLTTEEQLAVDLDLGRHAELIAELYALARAHPFRERLRALLMLALYRGGRQAEALEVFRDTHALLAEQLGVEPGALLARLHRAILRAEEHLDRASTSVLDLLARSPETAIVTTNVVGTSGEVAPTSHRRTAAQELPPALLPLEPAGFVGRGTEVAFLDAISAVPAGRASTVVVAAISGIAGVGKTALAVHWAHQAKNRFPDGQLYVNLRGFDSGTPMSAAEAVRRFLDALRVVPQRIPTSVDAQVGLYRSLLAGRRTLVVLDNARDAEQVRPLLAGSPSCVIVVTSRNQLASLVATEGAHPLILDTLSPAEAHALLVRRLGFDRLAAEPEAVDTLIAGCARLPLALVIVAARAILHPAFPLAALARQLRESRGGLDAFVGEDSTTDIRSVFSWSYQALSTDAARLFRLLGLSPHPDIGAAAAASLAGVSTSRVLQILVKLTRANLVSEPHPGRYGCHDLLRAYAAELAGEVDSEAERRAASHRLLDHFLHTASVAALQLRPGRQPLTLPAPQPSVTCPTLTDHRQAMAWFAAEHLALVAAIELADSSGFPAHAWQLAWAAEEFLDRRGHWHDLAATQRIGLRAAARLGDRVGQARTHRGVACALVRLGHHAEAYAHLVQAVDRYRDLGDTVNQAITTRNISQVLWLQGRHRDALAHAQQALTLYGDDHASAGHARALNDVGWYHTVLGDHRQAISYCRQALLVQQQLGDDEGAAHTWDSLGHAHQLLGAHHQSAACYQRALALFRQFEDRHNEAKTLARLGDTYDAAGRTGAARQTWQQALNILDAFNDPAAGDLRAKLRDR